MARKNREEVETTEEVTETVEVDGETKTKAPAGSSVAAQCKQLVLSIYREIKDKGGILSDTLDWLNKVGAELVETTKRNLPLSAKLEQVTNEVNEHWATAVVVDGKLSTTPEWNAEAQRLLNKKAAIENLIKKEKAPKTDENAETDATESAE